MQDRIKEIRDRVEKISPEPWVCRVREDGVNEVGFGTFKGLWCNSRIAEVYSNDTEFIVNSPTDIEFLLEALQEAQNSSKILESERDMEINSVSRLEKQLQEAQTENKSTRERNVIYLNKLKELSKKLRQSQDRERVLREALEKIRNNSKLWKAGGVGGCDQYAGLPPMIRIIDEALGQEVK